MLAFNNSIGRNGVAIDPSNYDVETGGFFLAIQEAYADFAEIDGMCADYNSILVGYAAEGLQKSGRHGMECAMESFQMSPVSEGFFGSLKDKIVKALKALKAKIAAFFKSVIQFLSRIFLSDKNFVKKYKKELEAVDPDGMKFEMYDYSKFGDVVNSIKTASKNAVNAENAIQNLAGQSEDTTKMTEKVTEWFSEAVKGNGIDKTNKQSKFLEYVKKALRGGKKEPSELKIDTSMISHMIDAVVDDTIIGDVDDMKDDLDKVIDAAITEAESMRDAVQDSMSAWDNFRSGVVMEAQAAAPKKEGDKWVLYNPISDATTDKFEFDTEQEAKVAHAAFNGLNDENKKTATKADLTKPATGTGGGAKTDASAEKKKADKYRAYAVSVSNIVSAMVTTIKEVHSERSKKYASCLAAALRYKKDED